MSSRMSAKDARKIALRIATHLATNSLRERARKLVLVDERGNEIGRRERDAIASLIESHLTGKVDPLRLIELDQIADDWPR